MISYVVASHNEDVLKANLGATLVLFEDDELIVVKDAPSIAEAYNFGQEKARQPIRCFVHHDVQIADPRRLRRALTDACLPDVGMVGVIGSRTSVVPWWEGDTLGSIIDARVGLLDFGPGGDCAYLDGLLLATSHRVEWDESIPGFHMYDHDMCQQMLARGLRNRCLDDGASLVRHHTDGPKDVDHLNGWEPAFDRVREKWSMTDGHTRPHEQPQRRV